MSVRTLIDVPRKARRGDTLEIRAMIGHPMETGYRRGSDGERLPRDILTDFQCTFEGSPVFSARLHAAISANPYLAFNFVAERSGVLTFAWRGDKGFAHSERVPITVE